MVDIPYVCIGSGPSLTKEQVDYIRTKPAIVIAVNDNYRMAPWANYVYAGDAIWWRNKYLDVIYTVDDIKTHLFGLKGVQHTIKKTFKTMPVVVNELDFNREGKGLGIDVINHGSNSGFQAINFAFLLGARKIILLGYDHQHTEGKRHWFGDHDKKKLFRNAEGVDRWLSNFDLLSNDLEKMGVDLVNCSDQTAINSCRRSYIELELQ